MPILLSLEIVQNNTATDILKTEIASGNAPDLIGPVGIKGRAGFAGQFLDMTPLIANAKYDMSKYPQKLVDTMKDGTTGALLGIPYAVYPSYIFFNKDLFDEAGLKYPPQKVGDKYTMPDGSQVDWNWDTVRKVGMLLSVDGNGKDATQAGFDPSKQTQWGFEFQWTEGRRLASASSRQRMRQHGCGVGTAFSPCASSSGLILRASRCALSLQSREGASLGWGG